ncbi:MAG: TMEM43 family protein [Candidatus Gracilibacteria bacterium]
MAEDRFTEVTTKGYGSRLLSALGGIVGGFVLFFGAFALLFWNEGRVDMSLIAKEAQELPSTERNAELDGKLVYTTGTLATDQLIGDGMYLQDGEYVSVKRVVEMYAWEEKTESKSDTKLGGSEETTMTYTYGKDWTGSPSKSSNFKKPEGHSNPSLGIKGDVYTVNRATIGLYTVDPSKAGTPEYDSLSLTPANTVLGTPPQSVSASGAVLAGSGSTLDTASGATINGDLPRLISNFIYLGNGTLTNPQVGDIRISYEVARPGSEVTVIGKLSGDKITTFSDGKNSLYTLQSGTFEEAVQGMAASHSTMGWVWRVVGFFMMWIGMTTIFSPLSVLLDVLPFLGSISRGVVSGVTFVVALVLTIITILLSMIVHNIFLLILIALAGLGIVFYVIKMKGQKVEVSK